MGIRLIALLHLPPSTYYYSMIGLFYLFITTDSLFHESEGLIYLFFLGSHSRQ